MTTSSKTLKVAVESVSRASLIETPLGPMIARATLNGISRLHFLPEAQGGRSVLLREDHDDESAVQTEKDFLPGHDITQLSLELADYFAGKRRSFSVPIDPAGTEFQQRVWRLLVRVAYGATISYGALAAQLGDVKAVRAVARANALNPIAILVPCHRVIGSDNSLTGYAGGLWRKRRLLYLEATGSIEEPQTDLF